MQQLKQIKQVDDRVFITNGSLYGRYSNRSVAEHAARLCNLTLRVLDHYLLIPDETKFIISKIANASTHGMFLPTHQQVIIDSRQTDQSIVRSICHESVHVDQVNRGELSWSNNCVIWQDRMYTDIEHYTIQQYRNTPWELEAFSRQDSLADIVIKEIFGSSSRS